MDFSLEICVDNVKSAIDAQNAGATRIELCASLNEGGVTPGYGTIITARKKVGISIHVIIRPRGGDFLYSDLEYQIMISDIKICREAGVDGIVIGLLKKTGEIDVERTQRLAELAYPMNVTFHRAFDMCSDPVKGLEDVIASGATRLLTSGQQNKAEDGSENIRSLIELAGNRIIIMPGSGITDVNIEKIARTTTAKEFHLTGRKISNSEMIFRREGIQMGGIPDFSEFAHKVADPELINRITHILRSI